VQTLLDYTATNSGLVLLPGAIVSLIMMPIVGYLLDLIDARKVLLFGFAATILAVWHLMSINLNISFGDFAAARGFQAFGLSFLAASVNTVAYYHLPAGKNNSASSLLNLVRNTGASMSIAFIATLIRQRTETHVSGLRHDASNFNPNFVEAIRQMTQTFKEQGLNALQAKNLAYQTIWQTLVKQASMKAVLEIFEVFLILFILVAPLVLLLTRKPEGVSPSGH
ncbi:MAG: MFS transporter, partial [Pyrinomonadaceae bacterium]